MDGEMPKKAPKTAERATPALTTFARIIAQLPGSRSSRTDGLPAQTALGDCPDHPNGNCERGWHGSESGDVIAITKYRPSWPSRRIVGPRFRFRLCRSTGRTGLRCQPGATGTAKPDATALGRSQCGLRAVGAHLGLAAAVSLWIA